MLKKPIINYTQIEKRIIPLVRILNEVPFIRTTISCQGHFSLDDIKNHKDKALVAFEVDETCLDEYEKLMKEVLSKTADDWTTYGVDFYRRYYMSPQDDHLQIQDSVEISPFGYAPSRRADKKEKRECTDEGIKRVTDIIKEYLERGKPNT